MDKRSKIALRLFSAVILLYFSGCVSHRIDNLEKYKVNGVQYGTTRGNFRARWWNFYERGRSFADGGFWKEAESDLRVALSQRSIDNRLSRTYGLHFIPYFGNRELGIVLYQQGQIREAIPYLERSLEQDSTEKTEFYLNLCQQQLSKNINDGEDPTLQINDLPEITNLHHIEVAGQADDNQFIDTVIINSKTFSPVLKKKKLSFVYNVELVPGPNSIDIIARDTSGNSVREKRNIILDSDPPLISISSASSKRLVLSITDENQVRLMNNKLKNLELIDQVDNQFIFQPSHGAQDYYAEFEDFATNRNGIKIDPDYLQLGHYREKHLPTEGNSASPILLASTEMAPDLLIQRNIPSLNHQDSSNSNLRIEVIELLPEMEVFQDYIVVAGSVYGTFKHLKFDGEIKLLRGKDTRFSFRKQLDLDSNLIVLEVLDSENRTHIKTFKIKRLRTPEKDRSLRAKIMLYPLAKEGGDSRLVSGDYSDLLVELDESGRFRMLEKDRLDIIKNEFDLVTKGWIKTNTAAKLGKRFKADYTLACTIRPTKNDVEIFGRIIDTDSKRLLAVCDAYELEAGISDYKDSYTRFIEKLVQTFPVVESRIEKNSNQTTGLSRRFFRNSKHSITIDIGKNANIKEGMKFVAYHRTAPIQDPETGELIIRGRVVEDGELSAGTVKKRFSDLHSQDGSAVNRAEYVVSR